MKFEIRSVNTRYNDGVMTEVQVVYSAKNDDYTVNVNGNFTLTAEEYAGNEAIERLEQLAKQHLMDEISA